MKKYFFTFFLLISAINANAETQTIQNNNAMLFVSLGMPTLALQQYVVQSHQYHIPLILRGLLNNHYPETAKRIFEILHPRNTKPITGGFEIDPLYFRKFQINAVPALVIQENGQYSVIYGNAPIQKLLYLITKKSQNASIKHVAAQYLENNHA